MIGLYRMQSDPQISAMPRGPESVNALPTAFKTLAAIGIPPDPARTATADAGGEPKRFACQPALRGFITVDCNGRVLGRSADADELLQVHDAAQLGLLLWSCRPECVNLGAARDVEPRTCTPSSSSPRRDSASREPAGRLRRSPVG